jgi:hypothetical protein
LAVIAVDTSGQVGQPPIIIIAARIKKRPNRVRIHETDSSLTINEAFHNEFINGAAHWRLKLSAILFFCVIQAVIKKEDNLIIIDKDFDAGNQKLVTKYIYKLFTVNKIDGKIVTPSIEYRSDHDYYVNTVDIKTKRTKDKLFKPNINLRLSSLSSKIKSDFIFLSKVAEKEP